MKTIKLAVVLVLIASLFSMCKKDSKNDNTTTPTTEYYVQGTLNHQAWNWPVPADGSGYLVGTRGALSNDQGTITGGITALVSGNNGSFQPQLGIEFKTISKPMDSDAATVLSNFITTGSWAFSSSSSDYTVGNKSVVIYYTDNTGKQYSSIGSQSGTNFMVESKTAVSGSIYNTDPGLKVKVSFSCILYPIDGTGGVLAAEDVEATVFLDQTLL
ncbi:MAG: hypothetical protein JST50_13235 [Bacteroidetes bacterium]|jgi:hypothetical protein|nr:hypothetical protein [Bacteroidota bacterium]